MEPCRRRPSVRVLKATGRSWRQVGETANSGFQIGVQRTLPFPAARVWELPLSPRGLAIWLGRTGRQLPDPGRRQRGAARSGARQLFALELAAAGLGYAVDCRTARMLPG
ncbi:MAG: hypothetical protein A2064_11905 [Spirochaetes bacterium GWB1_66_5]|nr:MAG: hypothetical protein A2064_11905 [Spirochaetes bacterium GWB1_66_5]